jgi:hypothetical protein
MNKQTKRKGGQGHNCRQVGMDVATKKQKNKEIPA